MRPTTSRILTQLQQIYKTLHFLKSMALLSQPNASMNSTSDGMLKHHRSYYMNKNMKIMQTNLFKMWNMKFNGHNHQMYSEQRHNEDNMMKRSQGCVCVCVVMCAQVYLYTQQKGQVLFLYTSQSTHLTDQVDSNTLITEQNGLKAVCQEQQLELIHFLQ